MSKFLVMAIASFLSFGAESNVLFRKQDNRETYKQFEIIQVNENWNSESNLFEYDILSKNNGDKFVLVSEICLDANGNKLSPLSENSIFNSEMVLSPNKEINIRYESAVKLNQPEMSLISSYIDDFDDSIIFQKTIEQTNSHGLKIDDNLYRYIFFIQFNKTPTNYSDIFLNEYNVVLDIEYDGNEYALFSNDTYVSGINTLGVEVLTNQNINASYVTFNNVYVIRKQGRVNTLAGGATFMAITLLCTFGLLLLATPVPFIIIHNHKKRNRIKNSAK